MRSLSLISAGCLIESSVVALLKAAKPYEDLYPESDKWHGTGEVHTNSFNNMKKCTLHRVLQITLNDDIDHETRKLMNDKTYANHNLVTVELLRKDILDGFEWVNDDKETTRPGSSVARKDLEDDGSPRQLTVDRVSCGPKSDYSSKDLKDLKTGLDSLLPSKEYAMETDCGDVWMDIHKYMFDNVEDYRRSKRREVGNAEGILQYMCDKIREAKK